MSGAARTTAGPGRSVEGSTSVPIRKGRPGRGPAHDPRNGETAIPFHFDSLTIEHALAARIQPKLAINPKDDEWEREADRNADLVVQSTDGGAGSDRLRFTPVAAGTYAGSNTVPIQRQEEEEEEELVQAKLAGGEAQTVATGTAADIRGLRGGGHPLQKGLRSELEDRFGHDFGSVRVHAGGKASELASRIGARAFTSGADVVFGSGEYRPETRAGKKLLAHELTHVVQQSRPGSVTRAATVQRKAAAAPAVPRRALDTALKGDDDDVRELTRSKVWPELDVKAPESATLMEHLLDGATVTEDELAGIKILSKAWVQHGIDPALEELESRNRFGQLLDDYHGAEYHMLLTLLSNAIKKRKIKALYLDTFIAMWWLNKAEEQAVVVLLERSADAEVAALLKENSRLAELRSDIAEPSLAARFELQVGQGNTAEFDTIRKQIEVIFRVKAMFAVGTRSMSGAKLKQTDVDRLLKSAAKDLAMELTHYQAELVAAIPKGDTALVRKINDRFRTRLNRLLASKSYEFKLELKWNKEFNRALDRAFARNWTGIDLDKKRGELGEIDRMLRMIPSQFLYASKNLRAFRRATTDPESPRVHGRASSRFITLFKNLDAGVTAHEVGHFIHRDANDAYKEFKKESAWEPMTVAKLRADGLTEDLISKLDGHCRDKKTYGVVNYNGFNYHWARYKDPGNYWKYRSDAKFVSKYARTDPKDDFAETFEAYLLRHDKDKSLAPDKFEFMHDEIFVKHWLRKEKERSLDEFKDVRKGLEAKIKDGRLRKRIWKGGGLPVKTALGKSLDALAAKKYTQLAAGDHGKAQPLKGWTGIKKLGKGHIDVLKNVYKYGAELGRRFERFVGDAVARKSKFKRGLREAYVDIVKNLEETFIGRIAPLVKQPTKRMLKGEGATPKTWPELDTAIKGLGKTLVVADSYVAYNRRYLRARESWKLGVDMMNDIDSEKKLDAFALKLLSRFPTGSRKYRLLRPTIESARVDLIFEFDALRAKLLKLIGQGKRYRRSRLVDPKTLIKKYRSIVWRRYARVRKGKPAIPLKGGRPKWF